MGCMANNPTQYALQILTNSGSPSARWDFDDDFGPVRDHAAPAWDDMDQAEDAGYRPGDLRVVAITPLSEPSED